MKASLYCSRHKIKEDKKGKINTNILAEEKNKETLNLSSKTWRPQSGNNSNT